MAVCLPNWMQIFNEHCQALPSYTGWKKLKAYLSREKVREKMEKAWRREARPSSGQPDIQRFERVKEREREKLKSSFDEKLARHAASASNNRAPQEDSTEENCGEARPKHPLPKHPSSTGQNRRNPPLYKEDESSCWWDADYNKEETIINWSSWSFDAKNNDSGPTTCRTGAPKEFARFHRHLLRLYVQPTNDGKNGNP